ncbi:MAG: hypothetical protein JKX94_00915 [Sneathiella sp.]|nr:hypothetical protein [Sneathiella sp.]
MAVIAACAPAIQIDEARPALVQAKQVVHTVPLKFALQEQTGFILGSALKKPKSAGLRICAAKMRYGTQFDSKIAQLFCTNQKQDKPRKTKFWVNFTSPAYGHKAWKINLSLSGDRYSNADFIAALKTQFGPPHIVREPLAYKWQVGTAHLTLREDQFGLQLELWDRSFHYNI